MHLRKYENMYITALSYWSKYSRIDQVKFMKTAFKTFGVIWSA